MNVRMATRNGVRVYLRRFWDSRGGNIHGQKYGVHEARVLVLELDGPREHGGKTVEEVYGRFENDPRWPSVCATCNVAFPDEAIHQVFAQDRYDTPSGNLEPGCMYWAGWYHFNHSCPWWDNCNDPRGHLMVVLPNGIEWDIDSRARNCTLPDDRTHRCWSKSGEPPRITAGKDGPTCTAGQGSIQAGDYHGFLRDGVLTNA